MVRSRISCFKRRLVFVWVVPLLLLGMHQTFVFGGKAPVEKTGQITSYSATGGEDGDLKKGVKWPNPRFTDEGNGTVKDNLTKLLWLKNANAFGARTWEQALADANALASGSAGLTDGSKAGDWRLPKVKEMQSLIDFAYGTAWSNPFSGALSRGYWSRATYSGYMAHAWVVYLRDGYVASGGMSMRGYVLPVRAGK